MELTAQQYQALLGVSESIASHRDLDGLFQELAKLLPQVVPFDFISLILHDSARQIMRLHLLIVPEPVSIRPGFEMPIDGSPGGLVWQSQHPVVVEDVASEQRFPLLIPRL